MRKSVESGRGEELDIRINRNFWQQIWRLQQTVLEEKKSTRLTLNDTKSPPPIERAPPIEGIRRASEKLSPTAGVSGVKLVLIVLRCQ
jgi:hypothetical protein